MRGSRSPDQLVSADFATEAALKQCSLACKGVVAFYLSEEEAARSEFGRRLLRAAAAIDAAAAAQCRRSGFDYRLLKAAVSCERAAAICERGF